MTQIRKRTPSLAQQAGTVAAKRNQTPDGLTATRSALLHLAQQARQQRNPEALRAVRLVMADVRAAVAREEAARTLAARRDKRNPQGTDDITIWYAGQLGVNDLVPRSPQQLRREAQQRQQHVSSPARQTMLEQQRQRNHERHAANCLAHALWALHQGQRDWIPLPTSSTASTRPPADQPMKRPLGPARLEVQVPDSQFGPAHTLHLYRFDYETLLELWGYHRVTRANRLRDKLRATTNTEDLTALHALALDSAQHPNLAHAWHEYVTGSRLGDVFYLHQGSHSMQLVPTRSGDLREAALEVHRQCRVAY